MQETRNNYFRSKIRSTTLRQAKTGKQEKLKFNSSIQNQIHWQDLNLLQIFLKISGLKHLIKFKKWKKWKKIIKNKK